MVAVEEGKEKRNEQAEATTTVYGTHRQEQVAGAAGAKLKFNIPTTATSTECYTNLLDRDVLSHSAVSELRANKKCSRASKRARERI